MFQRYLNTIASFTLCKIGIHAKASGIGFDACPRGCGFVRNPDAALKYEVILNSGERFEVMAINEFHAGSVVVYGTGKQTMDQHGNPLEASKVHRRNIKTIRLIDTV